MTTGLMRSVVNIISRVNSASTQAAVVPQAYGGWGTTPSSNGIRRAPEAVWSEFTGLNTWQICCFVNPFGR